jgi:hypothetical protein
LDIISFGEDGPMVHWHTLLAGIIKNQMMVKSGAIIEQRTLFVRIKAKEKQLLNCYLMSRLWTPTKAS